MPLAEMAADPGAHAARKPGLTHTDGVNGPTDITGAPCPAVLAVPPQQC
jgi:hypothetical protein